MKELLAKSAQGARRLTLVQHTIDVMNASEWLFGAPGDPTQLGGSWLRFFRIDEDRFPIFHINLLASAAFHDWGKANDGMQNLLAGHGTQVIRHEHLSGLLLALDSVSGWLSERSELPIDQDLVLAAVISHHLKADMKTLAEPRLPGMSFRLYVDHPDFERMLDLAASRLGLGGQPPQNFTAEKNWGYKDGKGCLPKGILDVDRLRALAMPPLTNRKSTRSH
jgi:hypothetical protein